jgi:epoxyqueuosine reductase
VVIVALNYRAEEPPADLGVAGGRVSRYAWGDGDYHAVLRERLGQLADVLHQLEPGCKTRCIVDTAPLLERDFARQAGLGWFGKNTMLLNKGIGSWFFLGGLLTDVVLTPDAPHETAHCGTCTRCLEACPTDAFVEPYVLDARKCISYLTIELRDQPVPAALREGMGEWLFGCDVCQDVCPWNRKAPVSEEAAFQPRADLSPADCLEMLTLNEAGFRARFQGTPLMRPGRSGMLRNACLVLGNRGDRRCIPALSGALDDHDSLIRGAAAWALGRIGGAEALHALESRAVVEDTAEVNVEIRSAIQQMHNSADG